MKSRHFAVFGGIFTVIICLLLFLFIVTADDEESGSSSLDFSGLNLSQEVLKHQPTVEKYAKEYGISDYVNYLFAIMQVESGGTGTTDVMQASESLGLPLNSLSVEDSIKQGCKYFSELLKSAEAKGCDINTVVQSYNYGGGFIDYVAKHGKKYTFELAVSFAKDKSGGVKVTYKNDINGLGGNDDCGQMSAWYLFSVMGFYPVCPGTDQYVLGAPYLPYLKLTLPNGKTLEIKAPGVSDKKRYVQSLKLNGESYDKMYITHEDILKGGVLEFKMSASPNKRRGVSVQDKPYSLTNGIN